MRSASKRRLITLLLLLFGAFNGGAATFVVASQLADTSITARQAEWSEPALPEFRLAPPATQPERSPVPDAEPRVPQVAVSRSQFQRPPPAALSRS